MFNYAIAGLALLASCAFCVATISALKPFVDKLRPFWQLVLCQVIGSFFGICAVLMFKAALQ